MSVERISYHKPSRFKGRAHIGKLTCLLALGLALSGCAKKQADVTGSIQMEPDYRDRHPIILANTPRKLEVYALRGPNGLDPRQADDVRAFANEYRAEGRGSMIAALPRGMASSETQASLAGIRSALGQAGVSGNYLHVTSYVPEDPAAAATVRLSFLKLQARVDSQCGQWKKDISGLSTSDSFKNQSPPNFGCAYQNALASQVANPLDLVRPRQEGRSDILKRGKDIESLREHKDPSTQWSTNAQATGSN